MSVNMSLIPPKPWAVKGNTIVDGYGQTIAVVFYKHYPLEIARFIAEAASQTELDAAKKQIEELEEENDRLEDENDRLEDKVSDLESEMDEMQDKIDGEKK